MAHSKTLASYGPEYELLLLRAHSEGGFLLPLPSAAHAKIFRMKLYAYFRALRLAKSRPDLVEKADTLSIRAEGSDLVIFPSQDSWDATAVRDALGLSVDDLPPAVPTAHSLMVEKLRELREKRAKTVP